MENSKEQKKYFKPNEDTMKEIWTIINEIFSSLKSPSQDLPELKKELDKYSDKNNNIHFSKLFRNSFACHRLYLSIDVIKDIVFTLQYLERDFELNNPEVDRQYLEVYFFRNLISLNIHLLNGVLNFLSYFFDLETKDEKLEILEFLNYLNLRDNQICSEIDKLLNSKEAKFFYEYFNEMKNGYAGLAKISKYVNDGQKGKIAMDFPKFTTLQENLIFTGELIKNVNLFLKFFLELVKSKYALTFGYDSFNDFYAEIDKDKGCLKCIATEEIQKTRFAIPIKIFNLIEESPQKIETDDFVIEKNYTFERIKDKFYRSSEHEIVTIKGEQNKHIIVESAILEPQEGNLFWTHTLIYKVKIDTKYKFIKAEELSEYICLLLSLFSGSGVYTNKTILHYSHKAKIDNKIHTFEYQNAITSSLNKILNCDNEELDIFNMILSKYREAMQPMSVNNLFVKLWEILDNISDFYCKNHKKDIPAGYNSYKKIRRVLYDELKSIETKIGIPLISENGFTPILIEKSIINKIREFVEFLKIYEFLNVDLQKLNTRINEAYHMRSQLTHSFKINISKEDGKKLYNYYCFISDLVFLVLLKIFNIEPEQTSIEIRRNLLGFVTDEEYYCKQSEHNKKKSQELNEFVKILKGEKAPPSGNTTFSL